MATYHVEIPTEEVIYGPRIIPPVVEPDMSSLEPPYEHQLKCHKYVYLENNSQLRAICEIQEELHEERNQKSSLRTIKLGFVQLAGAHKK